MSVPFLVSAPGKVIIFGEHSAVYNEPAVAASVSALRTYLLVEPSENPEEIELDFPDINFNHKWHYNDFASVLQDVEGLQEARLNTRELSQRIVSKLEVVQGELRKTLYYYAALCFCYLYVCLCPQLKGLKFHVKSTLPIGAGLGSSASISVTISLAMAHLSGHVKADKPELSLTEKKFVNVWSFLGEKCIQGTPSGIDNAVATYGNAVLFKREMDGTTNFEFVEKFPQIPMVLTYTKIPRSTKTLVAKVRELVLKQPNVIKPVLTAMGNLAVRGTEILDSLNDTNYEELIELVRVNHGLLVALGVSHPGLELVKLESDSLGVGSTKLTGAGGGGCSLTILHKSTTQEQIHQFKAKLESSYGYKTFQTDLGGIGCGILPRDLIPTGELYNIRSN
ncbi:mevalonate kinase [Zygosaccharomyces mellis]|uniref:Mevalonate kinase n=1 Tax=Zygosaccharomyces mellis TaxID=42258 RepID=A0A4C2E4G4_9SACH|nr:mevalonate kinase [Zygosaccharomyces mellis]